MKADVADIPHVLPRKDRQLNKWPDVWIAVWLARDDITLEERARLEVIKASRRAKVIERWGVLTGPEGITPQQRAKVRELLPESHRLVALQDPHAIVRESDKLIACPRETYEPIQKTSDVWLAIRYARHRGVPVTIVLPNGAISPPTKVKG